MRGLKKIIYIFTGQFLDSLVNVRVLIGYLIGITIALKGAYSYMGFAGERVFQIFEPYLSNFTSIGQITFMLVGFIIIISDAPFVNNRSTLALYRSSRGQWFYGMSIYIFIHSFLYFCTGLVASSLLVMRQGYVNNIWSNMMKQLVKAPSEEAIVKWKLSPPKAPIINQYLPVQALIHTMVLLLLYSVIIAIIIFLFNAVFNRAIGTATAGAVHIIGFMMAFDGMVGAFSQWSLFYNGIFMFVAQSGNNGLISSYLLMLLALCILFFCGPGMLKRADFRYSSGEQNE